MPGSSSLALGTDADAHARRRLARVCAVTAAIMPCLPPDQEDSAKLRQQHPDFARHFGLGFVPALNTHVIRERRRRSGAPCYRGGIPWTSTAKCREVARRRFPITAWYSPDS